MLKLEDAIERAFDSANLDPAGESMDIYKHMFKYAAIRRLSDQEQQKVYDYIAERLGF